MPAGSLAKAASVGAKTVNGPRPASVSTRPAAFTAATSVWWSWDCIAAATRLPLAAPALAVAGMTAVAAADAIMRILKR